MKLKKFGKRKWIYGDKKSLILLTAYILFVVAFFAPFNWGHKNMILAQSYKQENEQLSKETKEFKAELEIIRAKNPNPTREEIEAYMRVIFGRDFKVARAVSYHECNPENPTYPACVAVNDKEYSVGVFQINLRNKTQKVHFDKIPVKTFEEKVAWLKNPYNNILIAKSIFADQGFTPWSAYTNGSYKNSL